MSYIEIKIIKGRKYRYERTSYRVEKSVKHKSKYLEPVEPINKKRKTNAGRKPKLRVRNLLKEENVLHLDYITQRNLELITSLWEKGKDVTLYSIFNHTHTPMGARLLKKFILQPLIDIDDINERLNIVQKFKDNIKNANSFKEL